MGAFVCVAGLHQLVLVDIIVVQNIHLSAERGRSIFEKMI